MSEMLRSHMWNPPIDMEYYKLSVLSGINLYITLYIYLVGWTEAMIHLTYVK